MGYKDLRHWMAELEKIGELRRITAEVDWDLELSGIARTLGRREGPALLFENIKGYRNTVCRKLFLNALDFRGAMALSLGLPRESGNRAITECVRDRLKHPLAPVTVASGPVKENIVKGDAVDLYQFPVPRYNELDGGRYINTRGCIVTMDPDTKVMNVGIYRGMLGDDKQSIPSLLIPYQHWGRHFAKYRERGEEMPVAVVYGWDPTLLFCASTPIHHEGYSEYDVSGAMRGEPVELVKCELSDLYVPATAEIVLEGYISPDPKNYQLEGPFGEYPGFYAGQRQLRPVIRVECITHRNDPIFRGGLVGSDDSGLVEPHRWATSFKSAVIWNALEEAGVPNILGVWGPPVSSLNTIRFQIDKIHRGHAQQVACAMIGISNLALHSAKIIIVVDKEIDVFDDVAVDFALAWRTNAAMGDVQLFPNTIGTNLDPSIPFPQRNELKYGGGRWTRVLIDATVNWDLEPEEQFGGRREPPRCTEISPRITELINKRWTEYGL